MPPATDDREVELARSVQDFANTVHRLCTANGRADLAGQLAREAERYRQIGTNVVFVGDEKAGKSSLVNALLGDALLPVDVDVATATYVEVRHGPTSEVAVFFEGDSEPRLVGRDRLAEFVTVDGVAAGDRRVAGVIVTHPHPLLSTGLALIDTPGVGGLDSSHGERTLAALRTADLLVFTLEAGAPLSQSELTFLEQATSRIDGVVFTITKIDAFRGWKTILDESRALLARHAPRYADAPMIGVSSRLREVAGRQAEAGEQERAARTLADSNVPELAAMLDQVASRAGAVKLRNLVRSGEVAVASVQTTLEQTVRSSEGDDGVAAELEAQRQALARVAEAASRWRLELETETRRLGFDFDARVDVAIARIDQQLQTRINTKGTLDLGAVAEEVDTALEALWMELGAYLGHEVDGIVARLAATLAVDGVQIPPTEMLIPDYLHETAGVRRERAEGGDTEDWAGKVLQYYPIVFAAMMPVSLAGFAGVALGGPIAWVIGGGVAGAMFTARRRQARSLKDRRAANEYARSTLADARKVLTKQFGQRLVDIRRLLEDAVGGNLAEQRRRLEARLHEHETLARQGAEARARARAAAETALGEAADLRSTAGRLGGELGGVILGEG